MDELELGAVEFDLRRAALDAKLKEIRMAIGYVFAASLIGGGIGCAIVIAVARLVGVIH